MKASVTSKQSFILSADYCQLSVWDALATSSKFREFIQVRIDLTLSVK